MAPHTLLGWALCTSEAKTFTSWGLMLQDTCKIVAIEVYTISTIIAKYLDNLEDHKPSESMLQINSTFQIL